MVMLLIFLWGFSEATWFFIIPDVILSLYALTASNFTKVARANIFCLSGAMTGGLILFQASVHHHAFIQEGISRIPAIHGYMIEHVNRTMSADGLAAILFGPLSGVPYKLFAMEGPAYTGLLSFMLISIPARLIRFITVSAIAFFLSHITFASLHLKWKILIWAAVWVIVYTIYFSIHPL